MSQNLQNFAKFQKFQLDSLVDFEKCCKTHIYLQNSVPIQPKTSNSLPKNCEKLTITLRVPAVRAVQLGPGSTAAEDTTPLRSVSIDPATCGKPAESLHFSEKFGSAARSSKLYRARSRLYRSQVLQENMGLKAIAEIYTMHSSAQICINIFLSKFVITSVKIFCQNSATSI